ncbi:MAG TPA: tRNA 2-thiouridine(34) synthase MnmA [Ignavibacteriaceae bacterium]|nr:tRNA 2-thiouridine(34) synthase MnmA [Ignavibacteriaceae bacterium]
MKIAVLLSGGVDSSVALRLLKDQGHDVTAFYLKIWLQDEFSYLGDCPWEEDLSYAHAVCNQINVPLEVVPLQNEYWDYVVSYTISEIKEGRTPNPDIFCNSLIKFGQFFDKVGSSFDKVASGHYAIVENINDRYYLKRSPDPIKDQTYFLAYLNQKQLSKTIFPIGIYQKSEIRKLAIEYNLPNMERKDSQGICFLGKIKFNDFIKHHLGDMPGDIIDIESNKVMGKHDGYYYYTIGQRSGLKLGGGPWYVVDKDVKQNQILISRNAELVEKDKDTFEVTKFNWFNEPPKSEKVDLKIRHGERILKGQLTFRDENFGTVELEKPDRGIAPGQFAVFYENEYCLGGAVIL